MLYASNSDLVVRVRIANAGEIEEFSGERNRIQCTGRGTVTEGETKYVAQRQVGC